MPRQQEAMSLVCERSPIPVALDEDLIGLLKTKDRKAMLDYVKPDYIVLKPSLVGGFAACQEWIQLAEERNIGWWITSALESNVGLNAIAQFTAQYEVTMHQGLGTGKLFDNNPESPLVMQNGLLKYDPKRTWQLNAIL